MSIPTIFASNLLALRQALDWSQYALAGALGVSPAAVSRWEKGGHRAGRSRLAALGILFKVEPHRLEEERLLRPTIALLVKRGAQHGPLKAPRVSHLPAPVPAPAPAGDPPAPGRQWSRRKGAYLIVQARSGPKLARRVNAYLAQGYALRGPLLLGPGALLTQNLRRDANPAPDPFQ